MVELFDTVWTGKDEIVVDHCVDLTLPVRALDATYAYSLMLLLVSLVSVIRDRSCR